MFITLSEKRNEKLLIEWSGEISDQHAQDYCDVCNAVFNNHFDLDYMRRKYEANIYGRSFIAVVYQDNKPLATWGAWRNDLNGRTAFQLCDFATLPEARKGGYILDMAYCINDEISKSYPDACTYGYPGVMAYKVSQALGNTVTDFYARIYTGNNTDFQGSIDFIDDVYAENFMLKRQKVFMTEINGQYYLLEGIKRGIIYVKLFLGKVSAETAGKFRRGSTFGVCLYYSRNKGFLGERKMQHSAITYLGSQANESDYVPPLYKADTRSLDFNGRN